MKVEAIGYKLLNGTRSLNGRVDYSPALSGKWQRVPGLGAFVAHSDGLFLACAAGDNVVRVECSEQVSSSNPPRGVKCWRYVRMFPATAKVDGGALADMVLASPIDALRFGAKPLARIVSDKIWTDIVREYPYDALQYAAKHLAKVVPVEVWSFIVRRAPYDALQYAAKHLAKVVPAEAWEAARASCGV